MGSMIVDCAAYREGRRQPGRLALQDAREAAEKPGAFVWIGLFEPDQGELDAIASEFGLHELAVEDAVKAHQRTKVEVYPGTLFVVLKPARYLDESERVEFGEVMLFVGERFVVSVRHGTACDLGEVRKRAEQRPDLLRHGPPGVLYAILDHVVDGYAPVMAGIEDDIREVENQVFAPDGANPAQRIYQLMRQVMQLHQATVPLLDPLDRLGRDRFPLIPPDTHAYFRDVHDHLLRVAGQVRGAQDLLSNVLTAHLTQISLRQNEDMRKISAWAAIVAVPTLIAGIYGMNFEHMPELHWTLGYPLALALMAIACFLLYRAFRRSGWL